MLICLNLKSKLIDSLPLQFLNSKEIKIKEKVYIPFHLRAALE